MRNVPFDEAVHQALADLKANRLRSFLAVLGIVFGSAAVIAMLAIGAGAKGEVMALLGRMGLSNVYIIRKPLTTDQLMKIREQTAGLTRREVYAAARALPGCEAAHPFSILTPEVLSGGGRTALGRAVGAGRGFLDAVGIRARSGQLYADADERSAANVCVIGPTLAANLFGTADPVGKDVRVDERVFRVIGVVDAGSSLSLSGAAEIAPAETVFVPLAAFLAVERHWTEPEVDGAVLVFKEGTPLEGAEDPLRRLFLRLHNNADDMQVVVPQALLREKRRATRTFSIVMTSIAGISLLVGGIGITNIMLAAVLERIKEIGLRRAVGATREDIRVQFLLEASILCSLGGLAGVVTGQGLAFAIARLAGWPASFSAVGVGLSLVLSLGTGIAAGVFPARRAAALDPIEALRRE